VGKTYLMALDVGGGSGRCLLLDAGSGRVRSAKCDWSHPAAPGTLGLGYDLDSAMVWRELGKASREALARWSVDPREVVGIAATSMRNTTVVLNRSGDVIFATPNQDARALGQSFAWAAEEGMSVYEKGGHWPSPLFTGSRLMWLRENAPELLADARAVMSVSDWVGFALCGQVRSERSQAGETLLFDLAAREWAFDLIESKGFSRDIFPPLVDAATPLGKLTAGAAAHLGLLEGTPVAAGGADTQCGLLGAGAVGAGDLCVIAGTTLPVQLVTDRLVLDGEGRLWSGLHVIPGLYVLESNGMATGAVLDWLANIIYSDYEDPVAMLFADATLSEPGGAGAYSTFGACAFDARQLTVPVGNLTMSHMVTPGSNGGRGHVSRSLIEGIAYATRDNVEQLTAATGAAPAEVRVSGGMSKSALWTQILSDVTGMRVLVPAASEASAVGAAVCAGVAAGLWGSLEDGAASAVHIEREQAPGENAAKYLTLFEGWSLACTMREEADSHVSTLMTMELIERAGATPAAAEPSFRPSVLVTATMDDVALEALGRLGEIEYAPWRETNRVLTGGSEMVNALDGFNVFVTEMDIVDFEAMRDLPELRAVASCRGNPVNVDIASATACGIPVFNTPGRNADAVADLVAAFMIMLSRRMPGSIEFLKKPGGEAGDLARMGAAYTEFEGIELWRKTVGVVGMGAVGKEVARRLSSFGARVVFSDPGVTAHEGLLCGARKVSFEELLASSDYVTLHVMPSPATENMMDEAAFSRMKEGAFFVNTARASLVEEGALLRALESGRLAGAALDVFRLEPPASDDPLVARDDVITTPHIGGNTFEIAAHQGAIVVGQLRELLAGKAPAHILNPEVMEHFTWTGARREPTPEEAEALARGPRPSITS